MVIIYTLKENAGKPHISSWHALFGLCAMILTLIQLVGGLPLIYSQVRNKDLIYIRLFSEYYFYSRLLYVMKGVGHII